MPSLLFEAFAKAQGEFPAIPKNKTAEVTMKSGGKYKYKYADLADVLSKAIPVLKANGLTVQNPIVKGEDGGICLSTRITHSSGEFIQDDGIPLPRGLSPQEFGSALTYYRRYGTCCMLGIAPDEDEDGAVANTAVKANHAAPPKADGPPSARVITEKQAARFWAICKNTHKSKEHIKEALRSIGVEATSDIPMDRYEDLIAWAEGA